MRSATATDLLRSRYLRRYPDAGEIPREPLAHMPLARFGRPEESAAVAAFLASDECSFTTGHVFGAGGGFTVSGMMEG